MSSSYYSLQSILTREKTSYKVREYVLIKHTEIDETG